MFKPLAPLSVDVGVACVRACARAFVRIPASFQGLMFKHLASFFFCNFQCPVYYRLTLLAPYVLPSRNGRRWTQYERGHGRSARVFEGCVQLFLNRFFYKNKVILHTPANSSPAETFNIQEPCSHQQNRSPVAISQEGLLVYGMVHASVSRPLSLTSTVPCSF